MAIRCGVGCWVRRCKRARGWEPRTGCAGAHGADWRRGVRPACASRPVGGGHGAGSAMRCGVGCWVRRCKRARGWEPRTGCGSAHGAGSAMRCGVGCWVRRCNRARGCEPRTGCGSAHGAGWRRGASPARASRPVGGAHGAGLAAGCGAASAHGAGNRARGVQVRTVRTGGAVPAGHAPPGRWVVGTVRGRRCGAGLAAGCGAASVHGAGNRARGAQVRTVRTGGAVPARHAPPGRWVVRTVRGRRCGAGLAAECGAASVHGAGNRARGWEPRTVRTGGAVPARHAPPGRL